MLETLEELSIVDCPENVNEFENLLLSQKYGAIKLKTSAKAAEMILTNFNNSNRDFKYSHREYFKNEILNGKFIENSGNTIKFDKNNLTDGQHRLGGQVDANKTLEHLFSFDVDNKAMGIIDTGKNRKLYDRISIIAKQQQNPKGRITSQECKIFQGFINGINQNKIKSLNDNEMYNLWTNEKYKESVAFTIKNLWSKTHQKMGIGSIGQMAVIARAYFLNLDKDKLETFCSDLKSGTIKEGCPIYTLFKKLTESRRKANNNGGRLSEIEKYKFTEIALSNFLDNQTLSRLHIGSFEDKYNINSSIDNDK